MQLPNKLYSYNYSVLSKFPILLKSLQKGDVQVLSLFMSNQDKFESINDFIETLDALYALRKIDYDDEKGVLHFVIDREERRVGKEWRSRWSPYH